MENLRQRLLRHEGIRLRPYRDTRGILTIGVGRNLQNKGISEEEAMYLLDNDIAEIVEQVDQTLPWIAQLEDARKNVLYEMAFQMGVQELLGFKNTLRYIKDSDWSAAANNMKLSIWHSQTPDRCEELADIILHGEINDV